MKVVASDQTKTITKQVTSMKGGLRTMPFIICIILFLWSALSNFTPIIGAFLADSLWGRFHVISMGTIVSLFGMIVLWLTAKLPQTRPHHCDPYKEKCVPANTAQVMLLFASFGLMSIGAGGIRPCSLAFGTNQLDNPDNPNNERRLQSFFNWYYASVGVSVMLAVTVIVYIQDQIGWVVGFGVPVGLMFLSTVFFFLGSSLYVKVPPNKNCLLDFSSVCSCLEKQKHACIIRSPEKDIGPDGLAKDPWSLCTVRQVEELKALIRVLPIWSSSIIISVIISQHAFPVLQAKSMERHLFGKIKIPAASFSVFGILTLTIWVAIYDRIIVPLISKYTKRPRGLSFKQRIGGGLAISCLAMAVAAEVERHRRQTAIREGFLNKPDGVVGMSAKWMIPQHCLIGLAEALNAIGQLEFYYSQFPKSMSSIAVALLTLGFGVGSLVGSLLVTIIADATRKGGVSWVSSNLNKAHYDYYYWIVAGLSVVNVFYFLLCSWAYGHCEDKKIWDEEEGEAGEELSKSGEYAVMFSA
ncbi:protein NRT1/ PTR FAMILY 1.1-like [Pyrus ussuriensis x Pyrus communis]|uniref:Protein NRT1/ PTR FAMILY 1.1-like n=1 Tax=Pyrus ussuriensis x Pyrus communis TaxID=2448454 RepID=A0A5N5GXQ1_9ROSA|nr:protein NRT1/ PTR FAMILY 1.1-like [Pyrus ussuriensis x Pyrus communis]